MVRIQFELPEEKARELEALMKETGVATKKDFINNALTLLEWVIQEKKKGRSIASVDEENQRYRELVMPLLEMISGPTKHAPSTAAAH
jgi:hypothetical protein